MKRNLALVILAFFLMSLGWLGGSGLGMLVALVPLLKISDEAQDTKQGWWSVFRWALFFVVMWNLLSTWWVVFASPLGPTVTTLLQSFYFMAIFMSFHTVSKRAPKALAYTLLVSVWIAYEKIYQDSEIAWPWMLLGNGFSRDIWAVQWYEWTGVFGGTLWVLLSNISVFEAWKKPKLRFFAGAIVLVPLICSLLIYFTYKEPNEGELTVSVIQPNVDPYTKFAGTERTQEQNILDLVADCPEQSQLLVLPETAIPNYYLEQSYDKVVFVNRLRDRLLSHCPKAEIISGTNTIIQYKEGEQTETARVDTYLKKSGKISYFDVYNSAATIAPDEKSEIRHKAKLLIGVENTPTWIFKVFDFFVVDLGGIAGQNGRSNSAECFDVDGVSVGAAICYEAIFGEFCGDFVRNGAEMFAVISNDGWWGNTPGHKLLYSYSALRAVEYRRAIARSANTGVSGFITSRGDSVQEMHWDERGVLTNSVLRSSKQTFYLLYGDYIARIAKLIALLSILYYIAFRIKRKHLLN